MEQLPADRETQKVLKYSKSGHLNKLLRVLSGGCSVNSVDDERKSILFYAALNGHKQVVKELLRRGANPNQRTVDGQTPCHAASLGGTNPRFPSKLSNTKNALTGSYRCVKGICNKIVYYVHDSKQQVSILQYLVEYGGELRVQSNTRETTRDIAVRLRKMDIVDMIEKYFDLQMTESLFAIKKGQSMLRPTNSYPHACPHWMHTIQSRLSALDNASPLDSNSSLYQQGRCRHVYDYGYTHPYDNPGCFGVPEILPAEITKSEHYCWVGCDGSAWSRVRWAQLPLTMRQYDSSHRPTITCRLFLQEMDNLSAMRHPNIAQLMAVCYGPAKTDLFLVLEPLQDGSLHYKIHEDNFSYTESEALEIIWGIANAVAFLHGVKNLVHCIISSHAVYLTCKNRVKLCNVYGCGQPDTKMLGTLKNSFRIYLPWMAPELIHTSWLTFECDIYSIGVLLWELCARQRPWEGLTPPQLGRVVVAEGQRLPLTEAHAPVVTSLLESCFGPPNTRLQAHQLLTKIGNCLS